MIHGIAKMLRMYETNIYGTFTVDYLAFIPLQNISKLHYGTKLNKCTCYKLNLLDNPIYEDT